MPCHLHSKGSAFDLSGQRSFYLFPFPSGRQGGGVGGEGQGTGGPGDGASEGRAALIPWSQNGKGKVMCPGEEQSLALLESPGR